MERNQIPVELHISLTGTVSIGDGAGRLHLTGTALGPRGRTALAYLVLERDRPVPRDELADTVWGEGVPPTWRAALRGVLARVRTVLAEDVVEDMVMTCTHGCYQLRLPPQVIVDVEAAAADLSAARFALDHDDAEGACRLGAEAVTVARRRFLPGASGRWVEQRQAELRELQVEALETLSDAAVALGDPARALRAAEEALSLQPLRESAYVRVMIAHARAGNDGEALRAYERCRTVLVEELGACPSATTEAAFLALLGTEASSAPWPSFGAKGNLTKALTNLVGRDGEIEDLAHLLSATRLLTLTGTGGVGKSRLAAEVAGRARRDHPDGIWMVELAGLSEAGLVAHQVRNAIGLPDPSGGDALESLATHLSGRRLLLVLDNCEHLVSSVAELVAHVLPACPSVQALVTSREPLGVAGETVWTVPPLAAPDLDASQALEVLRGYPAVRLFTERAAAAAPGIDLRPVAGAVAEICRRLDGLPLAIELAAARVQAMGVDEIADRLDDRFCLLASGPRGCPTRHRSLRAVLDWSHDALSPEEHRVFRSLSVFASGFTLGAVEVVCADHDELSGVADSLSGLVARSLVAVERGTGSVRYRLLETVRQYAAERLVSHTELNEVRNRHLDWVLALAERAEPQLDGPQQGKWLEILDVEHDNLRAALDWSLASGRAADGARLAATLSRFWEIRGHLSEGRARLDTHLSHVLAPPLRATVLTAAGILAQRQCDRTAARRHYLSSLALRRRLADRLGTISALNGLGNLAVGEGDLEAARACFEENLAVGRELDDAKITAASLVNLGVVIQYMVEGGRIDRTQGVARAGECYEEALERYRGLGDRYGIALTLENSGVLAPFGGDTEAARRLLEESLDIRRELGDQVGIAAATRFLGQLALGRGDYADARSLQEECLGIERALGNTTLVAADLASLAAIALERGDGAEAARLQSESTELASMLATAPTPSR
jgi:predicted ATPase/DNA-binding SARP family transcriptional activator